MYNLFMVRKARDIIRTSSCWHIKIKIIGSVYFVLVKGFMKKSVLWMLCWTN